MIPRPGDVIQSNQRYVKHPFRYRVERSQILEGFVYLECLRIPVNDGMPWPPRIEVYFGGLVFEGCRLVDHWTYPDEGGYAYMTEGFVDGKPARHEYWIVERSHYEQQLNLFGDAA